MHDVVTFEAPAGVAGKLVDRLLLRKYMYDLVSHRAGTIRQAAESDLWKQYLI